jgi:hypothetical protein
MPGPNLKQSCEKRSNTRRACDKDRLGIGKRCRYLNLRNWQGQPLPPQKVRVTRISGQVAFVSEISAGPLLGKYRAASEPVTVGSARDPVWCVESGLRPLRVFNAAIPERLKARQARCSWESPCHKLHKTLRHARDASIGPAKSNAVLGQCP